MSGSLAGCLAGPVTRSLRSSGRSTSSVPAASRSMRTCSARRISWRRARSWLWVRALSRTRRLVLTAASLTFCAVERMESLPSTNTQPTMSAMVRIQHPTAPSSARAGKVRIPPSAPEPTWWACP